MHDQLVIKASGLEVSVRLGPELAETRVTICVALEIFDPPDFAKNDRLGAIPDHARLIALAREDLPKAGPFVLMEAMADHLAHLCLDMSGVVASAEVEVAALFAGGARSVRLKRYGDRHTHRHALFLAQESQRRSP